MLKQKDSLQSLFAKRRTKIPFQRKYYRIILFTQIYFLSYQGLCLSSLFLARVVQTLDSAIHRINRYPADSVIDLRNTYPLDSDLSGG